MFVFYQSKWILSFISKLFSFSIGDISLMRLVVRNSYKSEAQTLEPNLKELTRVIHQMWAAISQQCPHRYNIAMKTRCPDVITAAA